MSGRNELLDQARHAVARAQAHGAQAVRAAVSRHTGSTVEWRDGQLDRLRESISQNLEITLFVDGRYSVNTTCDLRPDAMDEFLAEAVAGTRLLAADPERSLPRLDDCSGRFQGDLGQWDPAGVRAASAEERLQRARELEAAARSAPGADRIVSVTASASDSSGEDALVTSHGMEGSARYSAFSAGVQVAVRDEGTRRQRGFWHAAALSRDKLASPAEVGAIATRRAVAQIGARPERTGAYPCIIENIAVPRLFGNLQSPASGNSLQQGRSFLRGKIGEAIASPALTVRDEPHLYGGFGSCSYDSEGMATHARPWVERGILRNYYLSVYYARKLGMEPTTVSPTNLVFALGERDLDGLLREMGTGILIRGFMGGNSNDATGDFSIGIKGDWIENGVPVHPISEMNLAGNHLELWRRVAEAGADPNPFSSVRSPSLRFEPLSFAGA